MPRLPPSSYHPTGACPPLWPSSSMHRCFSPHSSRSGSLSNVGTPGRVDGGGTRSGGNGVAAEGEPSLLLDNPDQRVTADAEALTASFATVLHETLVAPGLVVFYTSYLVSMFGWVAPVACYVYFIVASAVNW